MHSYKQSDSALGKSIVFLKNPFRDYLVICYFSAFIKTFENEKSPRSSPESLILLFQENLVQCGSISYGEEDRF